MCPLYLSERDLKPSIHYSGCGFATTLCKASDTSNVRSTFAQKKGTATVAFREFRSARRHIASGNESVFGSKPRILVACAHYFDFPGRKIYAHWVQSPDTQ